MTRDQAIEAGARAIEERLVCHDGHLCEAEFIDAAGGYTECRCRERMAAAVLDAIGWQEPIGYAVTLSHPDDGTWLSEAIHLTAKRAAGAAGWRRGLIPAVVALIPMEES